MLLFICSLCFFFVSRTNHTRHFCDSFMLLIHLRAHIRNNLPKDDIFFPFNNVIVDERDNNHYMSKTGNTPNVGVGKSIICNFITIKTKHECSARKKKPPTESARFASTAASVTVQCVLHTRLDSQRSANRGARPLVKTKAHRLAQVQSRPRTACD